jgi:hypothetical protein
MSYPFGQRESTDLSESTPGQFYHFIRGRLVVVAALIQPTYICTNGLPVFYACMPTRPFAASAAPCSAIINAGRLPLMVRATDQPTNQPTRPS